MVKLPWSGRGGGGDGGGSRAERTAASEDASPDERHADARLTCRFQDGTLAVYDDRVEIERVDRSRFGDKTISADEIRGVDFSKGITIGYLQIEQVGVAVDEGGLLSDPVNENTLHFGRGGRDCATRARTEIRSIARG
ncbi:hypothetical protein [Halobellus captivus]|uniref:hypothetical protein n=1 Tax=Halobellus captivus TaxID=2592614 RepID=UPI0011A525D4|nr:hypothetical protein [Halobellus captivus]